MEQPLAEQVAILTGAARGIGPRRSLPAPLGRGARRALRRRRRSRQVRVTTTYDLAGRPVTSDQLIASGLTATTTYAYDHAGHVRTQTLPCGTALERHHPSGSS